MARSIVVIAAGPPGVYALTNDRMMWFRSLEGDRDLDVRGDTNGWKIVSQPFDNNHVFANEPGFVDLKTTYPPDPAFLVAGAFFIYALDSKGSVWRGTPAGDRSRPQWLEWTRLAPIPQD